MIIVHDDYESACVCMCICVCVGVCMLCYCMRCSYVCVFLRANRIAATIFFCGYHFVNCLNMTDHTKHTHEPTIWQTTPLYHRMVFKSVCLRGRSAFELFVACFFFYKFIFFSVPPPGCWFFFVVIASRSELSLHFHKKGNGVIVCLYVCVHLMHWIVWSLQTLSGICNICLEVKRLNLQNITATCVRRRHMVKLSAKVDVFQWNSGKRVVANNCCLYFFFSFPSLIDFNITYVMNN